LSNEETPVKVSHIKKYFGKKLAVNNVSFGLEYGECFALLGISGAGKSTCFKCLTGEMYPSFGNLSIFGNDITSSNGFQKARKMIGYCP
jgi:ABC-type multidrug transport system ATPase subunit